MTSFDPATAAVVAAGLAANPDEDPHLWVPPEQRVDADADDPNSVANPFGEDLSGVDPDAGPILDIAELEANA